MQGGFGSLSDTEFDYKGRDFTVRSALRFMGGTFAVAFTTASPGANTLFHSGSDVSFWFDSTQKTSSAITTSSRTFSIASSGFTVNHGGTYTLTLTTKEPGAPAGITAETASSTSVRLRWRPPLSIGGSAITGYEYRSKKKTASSWGSWTTAGSTTSLEQLVTGLDNSTVYEFQMRAKNSFGDGLWSDTVEARTIAIVTCSAASEDSRIWTADLTVGTGMEGGATTYGWKAGNDYAGDHLTDNGFRFEGDRYQLEALYTDLRQLSLHFQADLAGDIATEATRNGLTLHIGDDRFNLGDGHYFLESDEVLWMGADLSWAQGDQICLALTDDRPSVERVVFAHIGRRPAAGGYTYRLDEELRFDVYFNGAITASTDPAPQLR